MSAHPLSSATATALPQPALHPDSGAVWFWVATPEAAMVGAIVSRQVLQYRFGAHADGSDVLATYENHRSTIDAAVLRRVASGSIEPVMLRENDLPGPPR